MTDTAILSRHLNHEKAKLMKARQEGFRAAIEMLGGEIVTGDVGTNPTATSRCGGEHVGPYAK